MDPDLQEIGQLSKLLSFINISIRGPYLQGVKAVIA
jgi:hypothetical protein